MRKLTRKSQDEPAKSLPLIEESSQLGFVGAKNGTSAFPYTEMRLALNSHILLVLVIIFQATSCTTEIKSQTFTNLYDLNFTMRYDSVIKYHWLENAAYTNYTIPVSVKDSDRQLYARMYFEFTPFSNRLRTEVQQRILLPENNISEAIIGFEGKGKNIKHVTIILDAINKLEKVVVSDTLRFTPDTVLSKVSQNLKLNNAELLNIRINAEGEVDKNAYIAFSGLDILLDNKHIDLFPVRELPAPANIEELIHTPINDGIDIDLIQIPQFNKKIIGLGESIHGNNTLKNNVYQLILNAVEKLNCKLILQEMPMEMAFACNRFIHDDNYTLDSELSGHIELHNFLIKLKEYNSTQDKDSKVNFHGIDYIFQNSASQNSNVEIFDFVSDLNDRQRLAIIDQFLIKLIEGDSELAVDFLDTNRDEAVKLLTPDEIEGIIHILKVSNEIGDDGIKRSILRDSVMFLNAKYLIDRFADTEEAKTIIYSHAGHINTVSTFPVVPCNPFGYYMRKEYKESYSPLLFLIGSGKTVANDGEYNKKDSLLIEPPVNSIEYSLNKTHYPVSYTPVNDNLNNLHLSRFKGSGHLQQEFFPFNLYQRYEGIFFIKKSEQDNPAEISFEEASAMFGNKFKQRQDRIKEIKERVM